MKGGRGDDTYIVDSTSDVVIELSNSGHDTVLSSVSHTLAAYVDDLVLTGVGHANAIGNDLVNVITGNSQANIIAGKGGADRLTGGAGADAFDYNAITESSYSAYDRITDLTNADKIDLSGIDTNTGLAGNQAFSLVSAFSNQSGQIVLAYNATKNFTVLSADVNGDGVATCGSC